MNERTIKLGHIPYYAFVILPMSYMDHEPVLSKAKILHDVALQYVHGPYLLALLYQNFGIYVCTTELHGVSVTSADCVGLVPGLLP